MNVRPILTDIIKNVLPAIKVIKISGTAKQTKVQGVDVHKLLFLEAELTHPVPDFSGAFGIGNIDLLKGFLNLPAYKADRAKITVLRHTTIDAVNTIEFRDANGVGSDFRCMSPDSVPDQAQIRSVPFDLTIKPSAAKFGEFAQLAGLFGGGDLKDTLFGIKIEDRKVVASFGSDHTSTHRGTMILEDDTSATFSGGPLWSHADLIALVKLAGSNDLSVKFSQKAGVCGVEIVTPIGPFRYYLRAQQR